MGRREGDVAILTASPRKAKEVLGFEAKYDLTQMCVDSLKFVELNK